jgi:hypothetical protein
MGPSWRWNLFLGLSALNQYHQSAVTPGRRGTTWLGTEWCTIWALCQDVVQYNWKLIFSKSMEQKRCVIHLSNASRTICCILIIETHTHTHIYIYIYIYMCVYIYIHTYSYIQNRKHILCIAKFAEMAMKSLYKHSIGENNRDGLRKYVRQKVLCTWIWKYHHLSKWKCICHTEKGELAHGYVVNFIAVSSFYSSTLPSCVVVTHVQKWYLTGSYTRLGITFKNTKMSEGKKYKDFWQRNPKSNNHGRGKNRITAVTWRYYRAKNHWKIVRSG